MARATEASRMAADGSGKAGQIYIFRFQEGDVVAGQIYICRGMKVMPEMYKPSWSDVWVATEDGRKKVECGFKSAVEDVLISQTIMFYDTG